jgi:DNA-binding CsgD family transcriptional regulator
MRERCELPRFKVYDDHHDAVVTLLRNSLGDTDFEAACAEGAALSTEEAIAYAQRGRGERKRPATGWASLTPTELDVVRLVAEGIPNKDIATRLFVSPRTVQSHLRHVYTKLTLSSRRRPRARCLRPHRAEMISGRACGVGRTCHATHCDDVPS